METKNNRKNEIHLLDNATISELSEIIRDTEVNRVRLNRILRRLPVGDTREILADASERLNEANVAVGLEIGFNLAKMICENEDAEGEGIGEEEMKQALDEGRRWRAVDKAFGFFKKK